MEKYSRIKALISLDAIRYNFEQMKKNVVPFKVGDTVVYPHHGAALIEAIETRTIKGEQKEYLVLKVAQGDLTVRVPAENAEYVGVRDVVGQEGLDKVFQVLRAPHTEEPTNWSRRYKANLEKLASGDVNKVAEVVRDLAQRDVDEHGLDQMDRKLLEVLIKHYDGAPVGIKTLAVACSEEVRTLEDIYEPYLIQCGLIKRTPRGRVATAKAYQHLKTHALG